eukprot:3879391-Pyramimonas_sp.AAC.1
MTLCAFEFYTWPFGPLGMSAQRPRPLVSSSSSLSPLLCPPCRRENSHILLRVRSPKQRRPLACCVGSVCASGFFSPRRKGRGRSCGRTACRLPSLYPIVGVGPWVHRCRKKRCLRISLREVPEGLLTILWGSVA